MINSTVYAEEVAKLLGVSVELTTVKEELYEKHIKPYKKLIEAGLPAVMTAHTAYPALDDSGLPATLSKKIVTGILKEELGFKGVVTTDEITMGGIISEFEVKDACLEAINAGCDLVLLRDEGGLIDEVIPALVDAVKDGRLSEERLDDAVTRTLSVKYDYGFFENEQIRDVAKASEGINDAKVKEIAMRSAKKAINVIRDENNILPLKEQRYSLCIRLTLFTKEQIHKAVTLQHLGLKCLNIQMMFTALKQK